MTDKKQGNWLCEGCVKEITEESHLSELWEYTISPMWGHCERCGKHDHRSLIGEGQWDGEPKQT
jgi:hypothetical protein